MSNYSVSAVVSQQPYSSAIIQIPDTPSGLIARAASQANPMSFHVARAIAATSEGRENGMNTGRYWNFANDGVGYMYMFGKLLKHDHVTMMPLITEVDKVLTYLKKPTYYNLTQVPRADGSLGQLADLTGGLGYEPICTSPMAIPIIAPIPANSPGAGMELSEVYCMAIARDLPLNMLTESTNSHVVPEHVNLLNTLMHELNDIKDPNWRVDAHRRVTPGILFRGTAIDEDIGYYASQFLLVDVPIGNGTFTQKYICENDAIGSITRGGYLDMQEGRMPATPLNVGNTARHIVTLRDLGSLVHSDPLYGIYFHAALIANKAGFDGLAVNIPNSSNFVTTGPVDFLTSIAAVSRAAIRLAWVNKWQNVNKLRPEHLAARVVWCESVEPPRRTPSMQELYNNQSAGVLNLIRLSNKGRLDSVRIADDGSNGPLPPDINTALPEVFLPQMYTEGSPGHPSYPAGHAVVAGACVTIMKAFLKTHTKEGDRIRWKSVLGDPVIPSRHGDQLKVDQTRPPITLVGELNKLASNVAIGRSIAGVHYRSDSSAGLALGEELALSYLRTMVKAYYPTILSPHISFLLERFNGAVVTIKK